MFAHGSQIEYEVPDSVDQACRLLAENDAKIISGGQSLTQFFKLGTIEPPEMLVDIERLGLNEITAESDSMTVGAGVTHRELQESEQIDEYLPILGEGAEKIDDPLVQNVGTIGGNIAQSHPTYHFPPIVVALDGEIRVQGVDDERTIEAEAFFVDRFENALAEDEAILDVRFPLPDGLRAGYAKDSIARGNYFTAQCAARILVSDDRCDDARIVLGSVEETPTRVQEAEKRLEGEEPTADVFESAAATALDEVNPADDHMYSAEYRRQLTKPIVQRALMATTNMDA